MNSIFRISTVVAAVLVLAACATVETMQLDPNAQVPEVGETVE